MQLYSDEVICMPSIQVGKFVQLCDTEIYVSKDFLEGGLIIIASLCANRIGFRITSCYGIMSVINMKLLTIFIPLNVTYQHSTPAKNLLENFLIKFVDSFQKFHFDIACKQGKLTKQTH